MKNKNYDFSSKKDEIKNIFNTTDFQEYREKQKKKQKRKEDIYKVTSIGNSTNTVRFLILSNILIFIISYIVPSIVTNFASYNISDENFSFYPPLTSMFPHAGINHIIF